MLDVLFVVLMVAFFLVAILLVKLCDQILGPSDVELASAESGTTVAP